MLSISENIIPMLPQTASRVVKSVDYVGRTGNAFSHLFCKECSFSPPSNNFEAGYCEEVCMAKQDIYRSTGQDIPLGRDSRHRNIALLNYEK